MMNVRNDDDGGARETMIKEPNALLIILMSE
jgi:hypothetical protein